MQVKITINIDNDAFADELAPHEVARILRVLAEGVLDRGEAATMPGASIKLRDINGNAVGAMSVRG